MSLPWRVVAWLGAGAFAGALVYFLFSYLVTFAVPPDGASPYALAWDLALFSAFALHHSVFARTGLRRWVASYVPDGMERSVFVWLASLLLISVCALWQPVPGPTLWDADGVPRLALGALQALGVVLAVGSAGLIGVWELAGVRPAALPGDPAAIPDFKALGPYRWVRHPIYCGWFLIVFAASPMTMTRFVFAVASGVYTLIGMALEERSLLATTNGAYERYARQVRWKLVPGVF